MPFRKVFCPECGQSTQINDSKPFSFCQECGSKIVLWPERNTPPQETQQTFQNKKESSSVVSDSNLEHKLEEVAFYYQLSLEKGEATKLNEEPFYYLKAQDILRELSSQCPYDYRVWWELCKPVDYGMPEMTMDEGNHHTINESFFEKALDAADITTKRELIVAHDRYLVQKQRRLEEFERKKQEDEAVKRAELEYRRQQELADSVRRKQEEQRRQEQEIAKAQQRLQQQQALQEKSMHDSIPLWANLESKNYIDIDGRYFVLPQPNNQSVIGVFRNVSNMLYLLAYRMDHTKGNIIYQERNMTVKFDGNGYVLKYDNTPVKVQLPDEVTMLRVQADGNGGFNVCDVPLVKDAAYVKNIMQIAKKPLLAKKMFM